VLLPWLDLGGGDGLLAAGAGLLFTDRLTGRWYCLGRDEGLAFATFTPEYERVFTTLAFDRLLATGFGRLI